MTLAFLFLISFFCGSIPTAYLFGKWFKGIDIRTQGSGNVGATNAFRVFGKKIGAAVFAIDFLKGFLPAFLLPRLFLGTENPHLWALYLGLAGILGHVFTPFLGFKGGKGVATGSGVLCGAYPLVYLLTFLVWASTFAFSRIVSLASMVAVLALVILALLFHLEKQALFVFIGLAAFIIFTHRSNIQRLLKGQEKRL